MNQTQRKSLSILLVGIPLLEHLPFLKTRPTAKQMSLEPSFGKLDTMVILMTNRKLHHQTFTEKTIVAYMYVKLQRLLQRADSFTCIFINGDDGHDGIQVVRFNDYVAEDIQNKEEE